MASQPRRTRIKFFLFFTTVESHGDVL